MKSDSGKMQSIEESIVILNHLCHDVLESVSRSNTLK